MARVLVPLADGVEEMEAVIIIDVLRRAGWAVTSAAVRTGARPDQEPQPLTASRGVRLLADVEWTTVNADSFDMLVLPGGAGGTKALSGNRGVLETVREFQQAGKWVCAICAAPLILQAAGILQGRRATSHPLVRAQLREASVSDERVVVDDRIVTSQGPGTAFDFALTLIRLVDGEAAATKVHDGLVL